MARNIEIWKAKKLHRAIHEEKVWRRSYASTAAFERVAHLKKLSIFVYRCTKKGIMDALNVNSILVNNYVALLQNMSQDHKLELIAKLAQSLKAEKEEGMSLKELFGAFQSERTADQLIEEIRQSRVFNREIEALWKSIY